MEDDPQERQMQAQCQAQVNRINDEKDKLAQAMALAQGSTQSLQGMLQQTRQAEADNKTQQAQLRQHIHDLEVQQSDTEAQIAATSHRLQVKRALYADFLRRSYKHSDNL